MKNDENKARDRVAFEIPNRFRKPFISEKFPSEMEGAEIVNFGSPNSAGGDMSLEVEYIPRGSKFKKRLLIGFNDIGMWIKQNH